MLTLVRGTDSYLVREAALKAAQGGVRIDSAGPDAEEQIERATRYASLFDQPTVVTLIEGSKGAVKVTPDTTVVVTTPAGADLVAWIHAYCKDRGATIAPAIAQQLARWIPSDFWRLSRELDTYIAGGELTQPPDAYDHWAIAQALHSGDKRKAVAALWTTLATGAAPELVVGMVGSVFRKLLVTKPEVVRAHRALADLDRASKWGAADAVDGLFSIVLSL